MQLVDAVLLVVGLGARSRYPVRPAIHKHWTGRLVLEWETIWEPRLLYVFIFAYIPSRHVNPEDAIVFPFSNLRHTCILCSIALSSFFLPRHVLASPVRCNSTATAEIVRVRTRRRDHVVPNLACCKTTGHDKADLRCGGSCQCNMSNQAHRG